MIGRRGFGRVQARRPLPRDPSLAFGSKISECGSLVPLLLPLTRQRSVLRRSELRRGKAATSRRTPKLGPTPAKGVPGGAVNNLRFGPQAGEGLLCC